MFLMKEHVGKLIADLKGLIYRDIRQIETYRYKKAGSEKLDPLSLDTEDWEVLPSRDLWGGHREYFYFETEVQVPQEWKGKQVVYELRQVFYGINIVMRRWRYQADAGRRKSCCGYCRVDLIAREMSALARLCALSHLDLYLFCAYKVL